MEASCSVHIHSDSGSCAPVPQDVTVWGKLHSFCVGLPDSSDLKAARVVADFLGTDHHEFHFTVQVIVNPRHILIFVADRSSNHLGMLAYNVPNANNFLCYGHLQPVHGAFSGLPLTEDYNR